MMESFQIDQISRDHNIVILLSNITVYNVMLCIYIYYAYYIYMLYVLFAILHNIAQSWDIPQPQALSQAEQ